MSVIDKQTDFLVEYIVIFFTKYLNLAPEHLRKTNYAGNYNKSISFHLTENAK